MKKEPTFSNYQESPESKQDLYLHKIDFVSSEKLPADGSNVMTLERSLAIKFVEEIGDQVAFEHPEIVELYKNPANRLIDIAYEVLPKDYVDQFPEVCSKAVGYAIRKINPRAEQRDLTRQHRKHVIEKTFDFNSPEFIEQCQRAAKKRHELYPVDIEVMIRARGREPWNSSERELVNDLLNNSDFQHQTGSIKGYPDHQKIADELNQRFHNNKKIRTANSVGSLVRDMRRKKR